MAPQWKMMWWKFRRHRVAVIAGFALLFSYASILITEFLAPYALATRHTEFIYAPPQRVRLFHEGALIGPSSIRCATNSTWRRCAGSTRPTGRSRSRCASSAAATPICSGDCFPPACIYLSPAGGTLFLLGTDRLGRDMASRLLYGGRVSLTVGLIGIAVSFVLGISIGGVAGYFGGWIDSIVQRVIEILKSLPELPLWMALSAALPIHWSPILVYFGITIILGLLDWPGLARAVRSKLLALREEDFCTAARLMGASPRRIIGRHLLPNFMSHLIASATLSIPTMILGETALSFLGLGLRPPVTSWGVLLTEAQNIEAVALYPWLLLPMLPVIVTVLGFNFLGDGLRDAADPYN